MCEIKKIKLYFNNLFSLSGHTNSNNVKGNNSASIMQSNNSYGDVIQVAGDINIGRRHDVMIICNAAREEARYNSSSGVGNCKVPFKTEAISTLLSYELAESDKVVIREYIKNANICNGREGGLANIKPGHIQGKSVDLVKIINMYESKFKNINK